MSIVAMSSCWGEDFPTHEVDGLSAPAIRVVALAIADVVNDTNGNEFYGSLPNLAKKVGLHRDTVKRVVSHLVEAGVVRVKRVTAGAPTTYEWVWKTRGAVPAPPVPSAGFEPQPRGGFRGEAAEGSAPNPIEPNETILAQLALSVPDSFDAFWDVWPKKVGKGAAKRAYVRALKRADADAILAGAEKMRTSWLAMPTEERQYVPYPERWLNGDRWLDEDTSTELGATKIVQIKACVMCGICPPSKEACQGAAYGYADDECPW